MNITIPSSTLIALKEKLRDYDWQAVVRRAVHDTYWHRRFGARIRRIATELPLWIEGHRARTRLAELLFIEGECFDRSLFAIAKYHKMVIRP